MLTVNIPVLRVGIPGGRHAPGHAAVPAFAGQPHSLGRDPGREAGRAHRSAEGAGDGCEEQPDGKPASRAARKIDRFGGKPAPGCGSSHSCCGWCLAVFLGQISREIARQTDAAERRTPAWNFSSWYSSKTT